MKKINKSNYHKTHFKFRNEFELFLRDIEEDEELRHNVNLYKL